MTNKYPPPQYQLPYCLTAAVSSLDDFCVGGWVICFDVGINGLLHQAVLQLRLGQETPHAWLVATLSIFVSTVQVTHMSDQNL